MLNSEIMKLSPHFPPGFARDYDAHIYFDSQSRAQADALRILAKSEFAGRPVLVGDMVDECVGPHPLPMFEINFATRDFVEILNWLMRERKGLKILVHRVTGDDPLDHDQNALWLGGSVELDTSKLDPSPV